MAAFFILRHGSLGLYGAAQRIFIAFALISGPASCLIDAPFGKWAGSKRFTVNGKVGWIVMEIVSPLSFLAALSTRLTSSPATLSLPSPSKIVLAFTALSIARRILAALFLFHYLNRAIVSSLRNPGRARMQIAVPLAAVCFNVLNGSLQGFFIAGGTTPGKGGVQVGWGLAPSPLSPYLFSAGIVLFLLGFGGNLYSDEILYNLKRSRPPPPPNATPRQRYDVPQGFLYSAPFGGVSHPAYFTEWIEWTGYLLATLALAPSLFPAEMLANAGGASRLWIAIYPPPAAKLLKGVPKGLWPLGGWFLQPPALFLWNEISAMAPRAVSGHRWYKRTFGRDWPVERKVVIPGVF